MIIFFLLELKKVNKTYDQTNRLARDTANLAENMPFKLGAAPIRRTKQYLESGKLVFKERVKVMTVHFNTNEDDLDNKIKFNFHAHPNLPKKPPQDYWRVQEPHHKGLAEFVFWNLPQVQYKNPDVQIATFKNESPSPYISCYMEDGNNASLCTIDTYLI